MNYEARLQKAIPIIEILRAMGEGTVFVDLHEYDSDNITVSVFPPAKAKLGMFHYMKSVFGKLDKEAGGTLVGQKDGLEVRVFRALECKVVGYKTVELPAEEARTIQKPIYECASPMAAAAQAPEEVPF